MLSTRLRALTPALALCLAAAAAAAACSGSTQESPLEECPDNQVTLSVSAGTTPTFSWSPSCGISSLDVFPSAGGAAVWVFYGGQQAATNPFRSGIRYGQAPSGALVVTGPVPLTSGTEYRVTVRRWLGDPGGPGSLFEAGTATFTP